MKATSIALGPTPTKPEAATDGADATHRLPILAKAPGAVGKPEDTFEHALAKVPRPPTTPVQTPPLPMMMLPLPLPSAPPSAPTATPKPTPPTPATATAAPSARAKAAPAPPPTAQTPERAGMVAAAVAALSPMLAAPLARALGPLATDADSLDPIDPQLERSASTPRYSDELLRAALPPMPSPTHVVPVTKPESIGPEIADAVRRLASDSVGGPDVLRFQSDGHAFTAHLVPSDDGGIRVRLVAADAATRTFLAARLPEVRIALTGIATGVQVNADDAGQRRPPRDPRSADGDAEDATFELDPMTEVPDR